VVDGDDAERPTIGDARQRLAALRRMIVRFLVRTTTMVTLLTCAYYLWPTRSPAGDGASAARLTGVLLAGGLVALVVRAQLRALRRDPRLIRVVEALLAALYFIVVIFSAVHYAIAVTTDQYVGLETRTDALYFTVTIVSTVGFGDVHAAGTAARALVTAQMLFGLIYIGTVIRVLGGVSSRVSLRREPEVPES
jgi:hypothetical protein